VPPTGPPIISRPDPEETCTPSLHHERRPPPALLHYENATPSIEDRVDPEVEPLIPIEDHMEGYEDFAEANDRQYHTMETASQHQENQEVNISCGFFPKIFFVNYMKLNKH